ncbi:MAG: SET domain-containing protein-lysine N-methyltransferase [Deltaproteobacteria bacterium]|nr:SET domain-containing protein-lysine N-methyltransferase [Deltaproteobacteria bacterium]
MARLRPSRPLHGLLPVEFRNSAIAGRGVFARRPFAPGDVVVPYAPKQRRVPVGSPEADAGANTKLTLLSEGRWVILPDTNVPGGWLCNHSCSPNAALYSSGEGRIQCTRPIAPGEEITLFYGWVTQGEPTRDPCLCGSPGCRGFINFDVSEADARAFETTTAEGAALQARLDEYGEFLHAIDQEQVLDTVLATLERMRRARGR